jgi:hypothetical protein
LDALVRSFCLSGQPELASRRTVMEMGAMPRPGARLRVRFSDTSTKAPVSYVVIAVDRMSGITARPVGGSLPRVPHDTPCRVEYVVGGTKVMVDAVAASCVLDRPFGGTTGD